MARAAILSYIKRNSLVHELTGTTKLIFFLAWSVAYESTVGYAFDQYCGF